MIFEEIALLLAIIGFVLSLCLLKIASRKASPTAERTPRPTPAAQPWIPAPPLDARKYPPLPGYGPPGRHPNAYIPAPSKAPEPRRSNDIDNSSDIANYAIAAMVTASTSNPQDEPTAPAYQSGGGGDFGGGGASSSWDSSPSSDSSFSCSASSE